MSSYNHENGTDSIFSFPSIIKMDPSYFFDLNLFFGIYNSALKPDIHV